MIHQSHHQQQQQRLIHTALILANSIFGLGGIIGSLFTSATNPLAFSFVREIIAGILLLALSCLTCLTQQQKHGSYLLIPKMQHIRPFFVLGFFLFANQAAYIVGIKSAGPVTGSIWQPSAPIFTAAISMLMGLEKRSYMRIVGVLVAFLGCAIMIVISDQDQQKSDNNTDDIAGEEDESSTLFLIGNALFFTNCLATALYILFSKELLNLYPTLTVTAWSYLTGCCFMFFAALASSVIPVVENIICPACTVNNNDSSTSLFSIPPDSLFALTYFVVAMSVGSWGLILWSNQYATGTLVMGYSVLQPVSSLLFTTLILLSGLVRNCQQQQQQGDDGRIDGDDRCLFEPGAGTLLGMLGVFLGLYIVVKTEPTVPVLKKIDGNDLEEEEQEEEGDGLMRVPNKDYGSIPKSPLLVEQYPRNIIKRSTSSLSAGSSFI